MVIFLSKNTVGLKMELLYLHVDGTNEGFAHQGQRYSVTESADAVCEKYLMPRSQCFVDGTHILYM